MNDKPSKKENYCPIFQEKNFYSEIRKSVFANEENKQEICLFIIPKTNKIKCFFCNETFDISENERRNKHNRKNCLKKMNKNEDPTPDEDTSMYILQEEEEKLCCFFCEAKMPITDFDFFIKNHGLKCNSLTKSFSSLKFFLF